MSTEPRSSASKIAVSPGALDDAAKLPELRSLVLSRLFRSASPARIGRYRVLDVLGQGGMGTVYTAHDDQLDRTLAIKVVRQRPGGVGEHARARLLREARALARLSHPNVVTVHEVGEHEDQVFVAMELVRGESLARWLAPDDAPPRGWREIVDVFIQAGRGLAAAHAAELVHRDFKPTNVVVGDDGVVKVLDFGLARDDADDPLAARPDDDEALLTTRASPLDSRTLTDDGALMGTPAYMSPEQFRGEPATARSDQFSFCASLHEALHGERPFAGADLHALAESVLAGRRRAPSGAAIPGWIEPILARGLQPDPAARWSSMRALLAALADDPRARRRRRMLGAAIVALLAGATAGLVLYARSLDRRCAADDALAGAWDADRRSTVSSAMSSSELPYAPAARDAALAELDAYAARWLAARRDACEDTRVRQLQTPAIMQARLHCLADRRRALAALASVLAEADEAPQVVARAPEAALKLPRVEPCADPSYVSARLPPPEDPAVRPQVAALRDELARVDALDAAGRYDDAERVLRAVEEPVAALEYRPLTLERDTMRGWLALSRGEFEAAARDFEETHFDALAIQHDELAARNAYALGWAVGYGLARPQEGARWVRHARAAVRRGTLGPEWEIKLLSLLGVLAEQTSELELARRHHAESVALARRLYGARDVRLAQLLLNQGSLDTARGAYDDALRSYEHGMELLEETYGSAHPLLADFQTNLGLVYTQLGRHAPAVAHQRRALATMRAVYGDGVETAGALLNLGVALSSGGQHALAAAPLERAREIYEARYGDAHPDVALARSALGYNALQRRQPEHALAHLRAALAIVERHYGEQHEEIAVNSQFLGDALRKLARLDEAIAAYSRALRVWEALAPEGHPRAALSYCGRGLARLAHGDDALARDDLERALALYERQPLHAEDHAEAEFGLARALAESDPASARAEALARSRARACPKSPTRSPARSTAGSRRAPSRDAARALVRPRAEARAARAGASRTPGSWDMSLLPRRGSRSRAPPRPSRLYTHRPLHWAHGAMDVGDGMRRDAGDRRVLHGRRW
ncbi:MAG: serine/threonine protein kinase [Myxococcales bacterium]|nr:serine/threonine protein kinase [Myxococcales bacterium]